MPNSTIISNILPRWRKKDRDRTKTFGQFFDSRFRGAIETKAAHGLTKATAGAISDMITNHTGECPEQKHLQETVLTKEPAVRQHPREQQSDISFDHHQKENGIQTVLADQLGQNQ